MTFDEAIVCAYEQGWYVYRLSFEPASEGFDDSWSCVLRALSGPPRREISRAKGDDPIEAICTAIHNAPELEDEVTAYAAPNAPKLDLVAAMRKRFPQEPIKRRI